MWKERDVDFQTDLIVLKSYLTFPILALMSASELPVGDTTLPR